MSELKLCQGTRCHTYTTKDRLKGQKDNKTFQTRRRSTFCYGNGNFCSLWWQDQWFNKYGNRAIDHFGRKPEAKHLTEENAWHKTWNWDGDYNNRNYIYLNAVTNEQRPLTESQYNDSNYTINTGE